MPLEFDTLRVIIESHTRFVLTTHVNPDGDGLGAEIALAHLLTKQQKQATILNYSATPPNYRFLEKFHPIHQFDPSQHASIIAGAEVIIVVDTNHLDRLVTMKPFIAASEAVKVCIDHHLESGEFADLYILDETSTATTEILYRIISYLTGRVIDRETAIGLYVGIMTDTGSFRYPRTDPETHKITAHLIQAGADPVSLYEEIYETGHINRIRLLGLALAGMQQAHDGRVAYLVITREMFDSTGTDESDTDAYVPYTMSVGGVQVGLMFSDLNGMVKVNFRSKGDIWINELAKEFGGNGHKNAAGARIPRASLDEIIPQVLEHAGAYLH